MSDHDATPDPIDTAYAQAEGVLHDEAARAARRARVLAAAAREPAAPVDATPRRRPALGRYGGWLAAASVAGVSVLVATQVYSPARAPPRVAPPPAAPVSQPMVSPQPAAETAPTAARESPRATPIAPRATAQPRDRAAADVAQAQPAPSAPALLPTSPPQQPVAAPAPPPPALSAPTARAFAPAAAPPPPARASESTIQELVVVTGEKRAAVKAAAGSPADLAAKLRDAAAAGRTSDVKALLAKGAPVDAPDDDGETALMKGVKGDHPKAVALLRRYGASLETRNHAGQSARDMAVPLGDPDLDRALGLTARP